MQNDNNPIVQILRLKRKTATGPAAPRDERRLTVDTIGEYRRAWTRTGDEPVAKPSRRDIELAIEWANLGGD